MHIYRIQKVVLKIFTGQQWRNREQTYGQREREGEGEMYGESNTETYFEFSRSVVSDSLRPHELQHARPHCPSPTPGVHPNPCPLSRKLTSLYVKQVANRTLVYGSGNSVMGSVSTQGVGWGERFKRKVIYVQLWLINVEV